MANKEQKLTEELQKCRENIQRTKELISYHRDILKKQERKADELSTRLDKEKMRSLLDMIHEGGLDIDCLRQAVSTGQISGAVDTPKSVTTTPSTNTMTAAAATTKKEEDENEIQKHD